jgi:hypothetical protein
MSLQIKRKLTMTKKKLLIGMIAFVAVCLVLSCSTGRKKTPPLNPPRFVYGITLAKDVLQKDGVGVPYNHTNTFSAKDKQAVAIVRMNNLTGRNKLRWDWHAPNGELYMSSNDYQLAAVSADKFLSSITVWHALIIHGDRAASLTGQWCVYIYLNDELIERKTLTLEPAEKI